jgi:hypothetical protein
MSLYENIHKKRARIKAGSGEKMRKPGQDGAPTEKAFKQAKKTAFKKCKYCPSPRTCTSNKKCRKSH